MIHGQGFLSKAIGILVVHEAQTTVSKRDIETYFSSDSILISRHRKNLDNAYQSPGILHTLRNLGWASR